VTCTPTLTHSARSARSAGATHLAPGLRDDFIARSEALLGEGRALNPHPAPPHPAPTGKRRRGRRKQSPVRNLLERLWTYHHEALWFRDDFAVPFDNNQAERDRRMVKVAAEGGGRLLQRRGGGCLLPHPLALLALLALLDLAQAGPLAPCCPHPGLRPSHTQPAPHVLNGYGRTYFYEGEAPLCAMYNNLPMWYCASN
jgi:hypothetical protein